MPMPARLGPTVPFLPPAPWQLSQFAENTLAPAAASPAATFAFGSFESGIGNAAGAALPAFAIDAAVAAGDSAAGAALWALDVFCELFEHAAVNAMHATSVSAKIDIFLTLIPLLSRKTRPTA